MGEIKWLKCPATGVVCEHCVMEATTRSDGVEREFKKCEKANKLLRKNSECPLEQKDKTAAAPVEEAKLNTKEKLQQDYLKERNEKLKARVECLEADKATLAGSLQIVTEDRDQLWQSNHDLEQKLSDFKKQIADLQEEKATLEADHRDLFEEKKCLHANIKRLEEKNSDSELAAFKVALKDTRLQPVVDWRQQLDRRTDRFMGIIEALLETSEVELVSDGGRVHIEKDF